MSTTTANTGTNTSAKTTGNPRKVALDALCRILDRKTPLEVTLESHPEFGALEKRDRAFARLLVTDCLRHDGEINALIDARLKKALPNSASKVHHLLALGIVQLLFLKTPAHAAVDTAVTIAATIAGGRFKGLVNAILRGIVRDGEDALNQLDGPRLNTPNWLWQSLERDFGADACQRIARVHMTEAPLDITLKDQKSAEIWAERLEAEILPTGSLRRAPGGAIPDLPGFEEGAWWIQDAGAALPARLFGDVKGKTILDLCSAPGGKTLQLAAMVADVTALDVSKNRLRRVGENLERTGLKANLINEDGGRFKPDTLFDGVLLDAPCTATGTLRRHPDIPHIKSKNDAASLGDLQNRLLATAARSVKPGGDIVYAVCSLDPTEGEKRIEGFLDRHPDFTRTPLSADTIGGMETLITPSGDLRTLPMHLEEKGGMDGFYAARLQRLNEAAR
ncbi:MAG: MFS transporter [Rhodospirillales bacterium]|nr:MFS transporter [Rhodospirillales bacterium]